MKNPTPPTKLSAAIRLAVHDCRLIEKMKTRTLNMFVYHVSLRKGSCAVCMAGAVMDRTMKIKPDVHCYPSSVSPAWAHVLYAIDDVRSGDVYTALRRLGETPLHVQTIAADKAKRLIQDEYANTYLPGRVAWRTYLKAAKILEAVGL